MSPHFLNCDWFARWTTKAHKFLLVSKWLFCRFSLIVFSQYSVAFFKYLGDFLCLCFCNWMRWSARKMSAGSSVWLVFLWMIFLASSLFFSTPKMQATMHKHDCVNFRQDVEPILPFKIKVEWQSVLQQLYIFAFNSNYCIKLLNSSMKYLDHWTASGFHISSPYWECAAECR